MERLKPFIAAAATGRALSRDEAQEAFDVLFAGDATPAQIAALLVALRMRGETVDEIAGAVSAMRARMIPVAAPAGAIDIVGTGGDGHGTYNVSTLAAIITAACGVPVAKHGNRAASSRSGSSDVLSALGVRVGLGAREAEACLADVGLAFLSAPVHHAAMRHVGPVRAEIGLRTILNLLGPLSNPAGVKRLLVGVYAPEWLEPLARVLGALGAETAWLVHGSDGLDEVTTTGPTSVVIWDKGALRRCSIDPALLGLAPATLADLRGGDPAHNAAAVRAVLDGAPGFYRDIACLNAATALVVAGASPNLKEGLARARAALDDGSGRAKLDHLVRATQSAAAEAPAQAPRQMA